MSKTVEAMLNGNFHEGRRLRCAKLDDTLELAGEAALALTDLPSSDVAAKGHVTNWTHPTGTARQWSLFNRTGDTANPTGDHDLTAEGKHFAHPALEAIREAFPTIYNLRLNLLGPASSLAVHEEELVVRDGEGRWRLRARFHMPVLTNPKAELHLDGHRFAFAEGSVYYLNNGCHHAAENDGEEPRLHLVWDCLLDRSLCDRIAAGTSLRKRGDVTTAGSRSEGKRTRDEVGEIVLP